MLVLILRNIRRYSYWYSVYREPGGKQHRFYCQRSPVFWFLNSSPWLVGCASLSNLPIPSAFTSWSTYSRESLSSSENHCRDETELNKHSFDTHNILPGGMLVKFFFHYICADQKLYQPPGLEKITDTGSNTMVENTSFSTHLYSWNQSEESTCFCYYKRICKTESDQVSIKAGFRR